MENPWLNNRESHSRPADSAGRDNAAQVSSECDVVRPGTAMAAVATLGVGTTLTQATDDGQGLRDACGSDPAQFCEWVYEQTGNETFSTVIAWAVARPLRIVIIIVLAFVVSRLLQRAVAHFGEKLADDVQNQRIQQLRSGRAGQFLIDEQQEQRSKARTETLTSVLGSAASMAVWTIAVLLVLGEIGISLAPLIAGAGIAGVAIGFGAQSVVRDFLSGFFMLVEDQYGVGDVIDVGDVAGTVERVTLRTTVLRDVRGNQWHVPNGEIHRVGNMSQLWSRALLDIDVAYDTDLRLAQGIIQHVADDLWHDEDFDGGEIIDPPEVWGVESLGADGISIRLVVKTDPAEQWAVARELRLRIKEAFDEAGIEIPFPQRTIWINQDPRQPNPVPSDVNVAPVRRRVDGDVLPGMPDISH